jgi:hypothetical protein
MGERGEHRAEEAQVFEQPKSGDEGLEALSSNIGKDERDELSNEDKRMADERILEIQEQLKVGEFAGFTDKEIERMENNPEVQRLYKEIFENGNVEALRKKSERQLRELTDQFFQEAPFYNLSARRRKKKKLKVFEDFVSGLMPVRADKNQFAEYLSPDQTGEVQSYGVYDELVHAEEFVYGSFAEIGHLMSQGPNQRELDKSDFGDRAQIVMNDISNTAARVGPEGSYMEKYIANTFDFQQGEKILAVYLASVFDTPEQAQDMLSRAGGNPDVAQNWDRIDNRLHYRDESFEGDSTEAYQEQDGRDQELSKVFVERMKRMLADTGIEPPLSLEIRIKGHAKAK